MKKTVCFWFIAAVLAGAQATSGPNGPVSEGAQTHRSAPYLISNSGDTVNVPNIGGLNASFEEIPSGSPATVSVTVQGCMRSGTCDTAVDTNTSTSTVIRSVSFTKLYDFFKVTGSWTGGTSASIVINTASTVVPPGGGTASTITSPLDGSGFVNVDCRTGCAGGNANGQATMANSAPVVIASNQSAVPSSQSGTWTVQPGNTANSTAWLVTGTGGVFPASQSGTWNVRNQDGLGNALTSNSSTFSAKFALDNNLLGVLGTAFTTPGFIDVKQSAATPATATLQSAAVASGNGSTLNTNGQAAAMLTVNCSTCSGGTTVNFEGTEDGVNYSAINAVQLGTKTIATSTASSGITVWEVPVAGAQNIRARISAYSAGTITVTGHAVPVTYSPKIINVNTATEGATGSAVPTSAQLIAGKSGGGNTTALATDTSGNLGVNVQNTVASSTQTITNTQCASTSLNGSASALVYISAVSGVFSAGNLLITWAPDGINYTATGAAMFPMPLNTGGLPVSTIPFGSWVAGNSWAHDFPGMGTLKVCGDNTFSGGTSVSIFVGTSQGTMTFPSQSYASVASNQQSVTASAVALTSNAVHAACVKALLANTINIYVGTSGVTTGTGFELAPGDGMCFRVANTNELFVIASATGASVSWAAN